MKYNINDKEFQSWVHYGHNVIPFFDYRIMREFNLCNRTLEKWINGNEYPKQNIKNSVIDWIKDTGYKLK